MLGENSNFFSFIVNRMLHERNNNVILKLGDMANIREEDNDASDLTSLPINVTNRLHTHGNYVGLGNEINMMKRDYEHIAVDKYPRRMGGNTHDRTADFIEWIDYILEGNTHKMGYMHKNESEDIWHEGFGPRLIELLKIFKMICRFGRKKSKFHKTQAEKDSADLEYLEKLCQFLVQHPYSSNVRPGSSSDHTITQSMRLVNNSPRLIQEAITNSTFELEKFTTNILEAVNKIIQNRIDSLKFNLNPKALMEDLALPSIQNQLKDVLNVNHDKQLYFIKNT